MKRIIYIILLLTIFLLPSCGKKELTVSLGNINELSEFIVYDNEYKVKKKSDFTFPTIASSTYYDDVYKKVEDKVIYEKYTYVLEFYGWESSLTDEVITDASIEIKKNVTFTPKYNLQTKKFTTTFYPNGGIIKEETQNNSTFILPIPERENYKFVGWYYNSSLMGNKVTELSYTSDDNSILYAKLIPTVDYMNSLINAIPSDLSVLDISYIKEVKELYNLLPYSDKEQVLNYDKLKDADNQLIDLEKASQVYYAIEELAKVEEITLDLKYQLETINKSYEALTDNQKKYITNLDSIDHVEKEVQRLFELYGKEALDFDLRIAAIPIYNEIVYEEEIKDLYYDYNNLDQNVISLLNAKEKLFTLYERLNKTKDDTSKITYILSTPHNKNIYTSKNELFKAYFTDFYYYIVSYHGPYRLIENGINNVDDFVKLAGDFYGGGVSNLYGIGNLTSPYMIKKDINGILENQDIDSFFGFCYQNNLYNDLLPFFINFFAYWRIDEKYANKNNYGADIFAEGWAPVVDIAKFFYYNEETSYVKTDRMIDCLTNTASVVYGLEGTLPTDLKLRGYIFEGWYDNPEFNGSPVTNVNLNKEKVYLYAKWSVDEGQKEEDFRNLVDIYIYNLTTSKAVLNSTTFGYVKDMFNKLKSTSKNKLKYLDTYNKLLEQYS